MEESIRDVEQRMRREWNERAREDAHFYVAFGRREQDGEEFFATGRPVVESLERELKRLGRGGNVRARRALEIGCGPGRLMRPMSRHFGEIHGVDVSDEMIGRARANLAGIPHAHVHRTGGADLAAFADEAFDFVYSYAVFQHIPSRAVVMQYLTEAARVLKPGGVLRAQINGLDEEAGAYDTWSGVRIRAADVAAFAREAGLRLLAIEGARTQYMWTTLRKAAAVEPARGAVRIRRITNAHNSEPVAPASGRFAVLAVWVENLPEACDLNELEAAVGGAAAEAVYIGAAEEDGLQQLNVNLPAGVRTGFPPLELRWRGQPLCEAHGVRVIPAAPAVPLVVSVTDGIDMLSGTTIVSGTIKVTIEEAAAVDELRASLDGVPVPLLGTFCVDPLPPRFEINLRVPDEVAAGGHVLAMELGRRQLGPVPVEIRKAAPPG